MDFTLHNLSRPTGQKHSKKRVGRGNGSGKGTFAARGIKGQKARSGGTPRLARRSAFQQFLIHTPKLRGFKSQHQRLAIVTLKTLNEKFKDGEVVNSLSLQAKHLVKNGRYHVKILGQGEITKKLTVKVHAFSATAKAAIEAAGGKCEVIMPTATIKPAKTKVKK